MRSWRAAVIAALVILAAVPVAAQDVTLRSPDGDVEIEGTLLGFDGRYYRVDTIYGELTVDGSGVVCEGPGCPSLEPFVADLRLSGSATIADVLMPALIEGFAMRSGFALTRERPDASHSRFTLYEASGQPLARFHLRSTTTDEGFADLLADEADVALAVREIRADEAQRAREAGLGDLTAPERSRVLALDGLVPVVAPGNPVLAIAPLDLARILAGKIDNWQALGGPDAPITLHVRDAESGLGQAVADRILAPAGLALDEGAVRHPTDAALVRAVASDRLGLGVASFAELGNTQPLALTGRCGFVLRAERRAIKMEDYPLTTPLFLYLPMRRLPEIARDFLIYLRSAPAQIVIRRAGFVDQAAEEVPIADQGDRFVNAIASAGPEVSLGELKRMVETLDGMRRLTVSFRFRTGSAALDAQSVSNVEALAQALATGRYDGRQLLFVGFSDGQGPAVTNAQIAARRAEAVRDAVLAAAEDADLSRVEIATDAFGEALPMACDESAWGRQVNRRVEVWVR
ncbi:cell envelope biogenesis protein OmpA [Rhodosalinus halophilus]|uniref:Cell envelope biogenesis protein OmpA n=1 Tax=Rhodosalinus halophilus TaxID=2259333 RepID=A0A365U638_9RHOB|nr:phosphate ABC transporter substrate-binding/OmpA family protein [Rhodosalinus halophilus]RBI83009.1 cell envelope biogenesis protein OmpA [Rhodosalinus halophilus]